VDVLGGITQHPLHALVLRQRLAETHALRDIATGFFQAALGKPQPAHAVREARGAEADLRHLEAVADFQQAALVRNFQAVEHDLAMPAVLFRPHDGNAALNAPARLRGIEQEGGQALALVIGGARNQDEMLCALGAGNEPLAAGDDPLVALLLGSPTAHREAETAKAHRG